MNQATLQTALNYQAYLGNYQAPPTAVKYHTKCLDSGQVPTCNYSSIVACITYLQACSSGQFWAEVSQEVPHSRVTDHRVESPPVNRPWSALGNGA
jgi:hypothetical protein